MLVREKKAYGLKLETVSKCFELTPGCLDIKRKLVLTDVSIKVAM